MWDEEINKKIKDAADQYHPAYDDDAWGKMEQLLDEHLPQKKDRRRIIYFIPLAMIAAGLALFMIFHKDGGSRSKISGKITSASNSENTLAGSSAPAKVVVDHKATAQPGNLVTETGDKTKVSKGLLVNVLNANTRNTNGFSNRKGSNPGKRKSQLISSNATPGSTDEAEYVPVAINENKDALKENGSDRTTKPEQNQPDESKASTPAKTESSGVTNNNNPVAKDNGVITAKKEPEKIIDVAKVENSKATKANNNQKKSKSFIRNFGIGFSLGPDVSAVKLHNAGKMTFTYGGQLSYSFSDKFTVRTGFYVAKKLYSAADNEYHVPQGTWNTYLNSIDADCKVYEVPLTLSYTFSRNKDHSWFASTGLSSYFMKRESYVYNYKDPVMGNYSKPPWVITNQNKHYFSVLDISGGYEYSFNKRFSLTAEPYVKIPLSGIGACKIKLNSTGVLFTVSVKPFLK